MSSNTNQSEVQLVDLTQDDKIVETTILVNTPDKPEAKVKVRNDFELNI